MAGPLKGVKESNWDARPPSRRGDSRLALPSGLSLLRERLREGWGARHSPASPPQRRYARASPSIPSATRLAKLALELVELAELAELAAELAEFGLMVRTGPNPLPC